MGLLEVAAAVGSVGGAAALLAGGGRWAWRTGRRLHDVHTALLGEPERSAAGVILPAVPGIGERLARLEVEFAPNHGGSMRDAIDRVESAVAAHCAAPVDVAHPQATAGVSSGTRG